MLTIKDVSFAYGEKKVLDRATLSLNKGEIGALIGASGSGKSTLFKVLTGMLPLQSGTIEIQNLPWPQGQSLTTYMMQEDLLLPWRTVIGNMTLVTELGLSPQPKTEVVEEAHALLEELGLQGSAHLYPEQLSGGMRQRVSLARALLQKRPLLLLDEPFGSLDYAMREQMYTLLKDIQATKHTTILMITHDPRDAESLADRSFFLANGKIEGR